MPSRIADISLTRIARVAGIGYLVIFFTGFFANFFVLETLIVPGDAAATTRNIMAGDLLFRLGFFGFVVMVVFDVILTWALYMLFRPVNRGFSLFAVWLRLVNCAVFAMALYHLFSVQHLLDGSPYLKAFEPDLLQAQVMLFLNMFNDTWLVGLIFFGLHLLVLGYLVVRSGIIPRILGLLLILAGVGYLADSFANILLRDYAAYKDVFLLAVALPGVVGELSFSLWLLFKGVKVPGEETV